MEPQKEEEPLADEPVHDKVKSDEDSDEDRESGSEDEGGVRAKFRNKKRDLETDDTPAADEDQLQTNQRGGQAPNTAATAVVDNEEIQRRAKRAARFGDQLKQPEPEPVVKEPIVFKYEEGIDASLPWSERKRLMVMQKGNNQWGDQKYVAPVLQAGFNPLDEQEKLKAKKRLERFHENMTEKVEEIQKEESKEKRGERFGIVPVKDDSIVLDVLKVLRLKPEQVYRNDEVRKDPPMIPEDSDDAGHADDGATGSGDESGGGFLKTPQVSEVGICHHKLHLFGLHVDKHNFTKIRSPDRMNYLKAYNPTYVEWLNDRSCNIHFADEFSATRAFQHFFKQLPPYDLVLDHVKKTEAAKKEAMSRKSKMLSGMNSVLNKAIEQATVTRKAKTGAAASATQAQEQQTESEENAAQEDASDPSTASEKQNEEVAGKEKSDDETLDETKLPTTVTTDEVTANEVSTNELPTTVVLDEATPQVTEKDGAALTAAPVEEVFRSCIEDMSDLGSMNWRIGPPLAKHKADNFGNKGVSCRVICRFAYDFDVLLEKPKVPTSFNHSYKKKGNGGGGGGRQQFASSSFSNKRKHNNAVNLDGALPSSYRSSSVEDVSNIKIKSLKTDK